MSKFTVRQGSRYRANVILGIFESLVSNDTVAGYIRKAGFTEVEVTGSGRRRQATGLWPLPDTTAEVPDQVDPHSVEQV